MQEAAGEWEAASSSYLAGDAPTDAVTVLAKRNTAAALQASVELADKIAGSGHPAAHRQVQNSVIYWLSFTVC